jgi:PIN domain nuclease of toxin-antitoxin system
VEQAYLLDASALIALIRNEPGADRVKTVLDPARFTPSTWPRWSAK